LRRGGKPLLQWKSKVITYSKIVFVSLGYPACNGHAQCCHLRPTWLYYIFLHYFKKCTIFEEGYCLFQFPLKVLSERFFILRRTEWGGIFKNTYWSACKAPLILVRFWWELKVSRQISEKCSNTNFHESLSSGNRGVWCGQRNGHG
jgi:hypothetical protein